MTQYNLLRYEQNRDNSGSVIGIFISTQIIDNKNNKWVLEYNLNPNQLSSVLTKESNLIPIIEELCAQAEKKLDDYLPTMPLPPIIADSAKLNSFEISANNVAAYKASIMASSIKASSILTLK